MRAPDPGGPTRSARADRRRPFRGAGHEQRDAEGKRADLLLLTGTDLRLDTLNTRIRTVWHNGRRTTAA
ncbi:hypothetical protein [Streptomyces sp. SBT349]|uniref:hypothetical protein n=1 Tax=Streptomyces sp. SBT349 TaxID=1580539 RepID=UPI00066BED54|nr:hypothetical protein [Streptomyces sp. SBT349]